MVRESIPADQRPASPPAVPLKILVPYAEVFGQDVQISDVITALSTFSAEAFLFTAAKINWYLQLRGQLPEAQQTLAASYIDRGLLDEINKWIKASPQLGYLPPIFHRQQQLSLMRWAPLVCRESGQDITGEAVHLFGKTCLMMNDFLHPSDTDFPQDPDAKKAEVMARLLPIYELSRPPRLVNSLVRGHEMTMGILPTLKDGPKFQEQFTASTGFTLSLGTLVCSLGSGPFST